MYVLVEPLSGPELDRLITALLNSTGVVHRVIEGTEHPPAGDGAEIIGRVAQRLRSMLAVLTEHYSDDELEPATRVLTAITLLVAQELDLDHHFRSDG